MISRNNFVETVPPWFSKTEPKPMYESKDAQARRGCERQSFLAH